MRRLFVFMVIVCAAVPAQGKFLDRDREGFFITGGVGGGYTTFEHEFKVMTSDTTVETRVQTENTLGPSVTLRLGGGLGDQVQIFFMLRSVWFDEPTGAGTKEEIITSTHTGVGMLIFKNLEGSTPYFFGSMGFNHWWAPFADDAHRLTGFGVVGGIGYQFLRRFAVEAVVSYGTPQTDVERVKVWTFGASLNLTIF